MKYEQLQYSVIFQKLFDKVRREGLLDKLQRIGIRGALLTWFKSYPTQHSQCVVINNQVSSPRIINAGVPQGSVFGPLLYLYALWTSLIFIYPFEKW